MVIFPSVDIRDGKCVQLQQGDFARQTVYSGSPVDVASRYARQGFRFIHVTDLNGAESGQPVHTGILGRIAEIPSLKVQGGGGVRSLRSLERVQSTGIDRVVLGSIAVSQPEVVYQWIEMYGPGRLAIAIDVKDDGVVTNGWRASTDQTPESIIERYAHRGVRRFVCTDVSREGMRSGPSLALYGRLRQEYPTAELVASGGISGIDDVVRLDELGMFGAVIGTALLDRSIDVRELKEFL